MDKKKWMVIERVVAILEKVLSPNAVILHDQKIPETLTGEPRQCDIAIWWGEPPRRTLGAIVEVQDRNKKVGINVYEGWHAKREKLRAGRLICVSRKGFTRAVEADAQLQGERVSLMTLCESGEMHPLLSKFNSFIWDAEILLSRDGFVIFDQSKPSVTFKIADKVFETPEGTAVSIDQLAEESRERGTRLDVQSRKVDEQRTDYRYHLDFGRAGVPLLLLHEGERFPVWAIEVLDRMESRSECLDLTVLAYEQKLIEGAVAWVALAKGTYEGQEFYIQQPFSKGKNGTIMMWPSQMSKIPGVTEVSHSTLVSVSVAQDTKNVS